MRYRLLPPCAIPLILCLLSLPAFAGIPDPFGSYVAPCIVACPAADSSFVVIARHFNGSPWMHGQVIVDLCGCPNLRLVNGRNQPYVVMPSGCAIERDPDALGVSLFPIAGGGTCSSGGAKVLVDGILFGFRAVASPDQDGDWVVSETDIARIEAKLGFNDPTADFDCDGLVSPADVEIARSHLGHMADLSTALNAASWGRVKVVYR